MRGFPKSPCYPPPLHFLFFLNSPPALVVVTQACPTLCDPRDCSTPGFPVLHHLPELAQTHVRGVRDAIQPSYPLSSPSSPAFNLSQLQGLFQWERFFPLEKTPQSWTLITCSPLQPSCVEEMDCHYFKIKFAYS